MDIDSGLKIRLTISTIVGLLLLGVFIERMSYRSVVAAPRQPSSNSERIIEACDSEDCATQSASDENGDSEAAEIKPVKKH
jgi:hypothetical protein